MIEHNPMCCGASMTHLSVRLATTTAGMNIHSNVWECSKCRCQLAFPIRYTRVTSQPQQPTPVTTKRSNHKWK